MFRAAWRGAAVAALVAAIAGAVPAAADNRITMPDSAIVRREVGARPTFTWTPRPGSATQRFAITEVTAGGGIAYDGDAMATSSIGLMQNVGQDWAFGGSLDGYSGYQGGATISARARRWLPHRQAVEVALGVVPNPSGHGMIGAVAALRYAPFTQVFVQGGVASVQRHEFVNGPGGYLLDNDPRMRAFYGAGFAGPSGGALLLVEAALVVALIALLARSD